MSQIRIFISSRERELEPEREIAERTIKALEMDPVRFEKDLVPQSRNPRAAFLDGVNQSDLVTLILWKEYSSAVADEYHYAKRGGKEILCAIKELRTEWGERRDKDLQRFIMQVRQSGFSTSSFRSLDQLEKALRQGIALSLARRLQSPFQASGKEQLFKTGTRLIEQAQTRVVLVAKTPIPLVGTRPYDESQCPVPFEAEQLEAFEKLIQKASSGQRIRFRCVASVYGMIADINGGPRKFRSRVRQRLTKCYHQTSKKQSQFELKWIPKTNPIHMTYLVADADFIIWLKDAAREDVWITDTHERIAGALDNLSTLLSLKLSFQQALRAVGLGK